MEDCKTIAAFLQDYLLKDYGSTYGIVNSSAYDGSISNYARLFADPVSDNDVVIIMTSQFEIWKSMEERYAHKLYCMNSLQNIYKEIERPLDCVLDSGMHCNHIVNKKIAEKMYTDISPMLEENVIQQSKGRVLQSYYISWDIVEYYKRYFGKQGIQRMDGMYVGAIVMNCNPFTKGHQYLIEEAAKQVDKLFVLVVEEDKSVFPFEIRFEMVKSGTEHIKNVSVIPSGEYVISSKTFEQYFKKEHVSRVDDMDFDVRIFGEVVAKELNISCRFVGEEPYDKVTAKYNETMKKILPEYGIEVIEMQRKEDVTGEIISATKVRRYLTEKNTNKLNDMIPESTKKILEGY